MYSSQLLCEVTRVLIMLIVSASEFCLLDLEEKQNILMFFFNC